MKYAGGGLRTALITATRGEQGTEGDPAICTREELPACRERELAEARIIGFDEHHVLDADRRAAR